MSDVVGAVARFTATSPTPAMLFHFRLPFLPAAKIAPFAGLFVAALALTAVPRIRAADTLTQVGVARIDITPELPIRLSGYQSAARANEATQVERRLFGRALAIGSDAQQPVVLITAEIIGVSDEITRAVAEALQRSHRIDRARVAVCVTHVHTGPHIRGVLPHMFGRDLPADETARIARYTDTLQEKLIRVATAALADRRSASIAWGEGKASFAMQRRKIVNGKHVGFGAIPDGVVDHALPVMRIADEHGNVRAVFTSYACHCTTLGASENFVHADWAGEAAAQIESAQSGSTALIAIGCGADANPNPRTGPADAVRHGAEIATEVKRVLALSLRTVGPITVAKFRQIDLPLDHVVSREELVKRQADSNVLTKYAAAKFLAELDAGRPVASTIPYPVQTWCFGSELAMTFLGGEVVSEYSLRLRRELDPTRLWVNAYANSVPAYIASRRMMDEGGYEVDASMNYYGWPTRLARNAEDEIIRTVHELLPAAFSRPPALATPNAKSSR